MEKPGFTKLFSKCVFALVAGSAAYAGSVAPDLDSIQASHPNQSVQVIVKYASPSATNNIATGNSTPSYCLGSKIADLPGAALCGMSAASAKALANNPGVSHVSLNHSLQATGSSLPVYDYLPESVRTKASSIAAAASPDPSAGAGIGVAVIDSGIYSASLDLVDASGALRGHSHVIQGADFTGEGFNDDYGHGTHLAGIIAGDGTNSSGPQFGNIIHGIAPGVTLISLKVLDHTGASTDAQVISAIEWAIQHKAQYNIKVINLSLGRGVFESYKTDPLCQEAEKAWLAGITVVVAAGNGGRYQRTNGYFTIAAPGNDPLVLTVGAMNTKSTPSRSG